MHMYQLFHKFWRHQRSINLVDAFTLFQPLPPIDAPTSRRRCRRTTSPSGSTSTSRSPIRPRTGSSSQSILARLTETTDVVLLNPDLRLDDHLDLESRISSGRLHTVKHLMTPRNNLAIQTKVISGARAFIGTYGGLSYVPPFYGVDSLAIYSNPAKFSIYHLQVALNGFAKLKPGSFTAVDARALDLVGLAAEREATSDSLR